MSDVRKRAAIAFGVVALALGLLAGGCGGGYGGGDDGTTGSTTTGSGRY